jgi:tRNA(Ile)-lysidine synthase
LGAAEFHPDRLDDILLALRKKRVGARFDHGGVHVLVDREQLIIHPGPGELSSCTISTPDNVPAGLPMMITRCTLAEVDLRQGPCVAWMDARALQWPLIVRPWRPGDRIRPFAGNGSKLISDMLIDRKVPGHRKPHCHVLTSGATIAWLCGYRLAEGFQLQDDTAEVLRFQWSGWPAPDR